ncbi:MAG: BREX system ATP-binding domain-containing protein [Euryarchaeota archaeon]|nr:BREX system ATP-binding domain-containing protein [Euryarchaeota archaeon]
MELEYGLYKEGIDPISARKIIEIVGGQGNPPEYGFQYFTAGLDNYLGTIDEDYLGSFVKDGGSAFKMVIGVYGGGKTHFLYCIREIAWNYDYIASYIVLSPEQTPFYKLEQVYRTIASNLIYPQTPEELLSGYDRGIEAVIKAWYSRKYQEMAGKLPDDLIAQELNAYASALGPYESTSFRNAVKEAFLSLTERRDDDFTLIIQWLEGENPPKNLLKDFKIFEKIDKSTAFKMIRSLVQWVRDIGYAGIVVLMDEAEQTPSMTTKQKAALLSNMRELIDECGHTNFRNAMWFYAVPDENFLEGRTQVYEALRQRLSSVFDATTNPTGVKIYLEETSADPIELLTDIGKKLSAIYEVAYRVKFETVALDETIADVAKAAYERKLEIGYKREFVKNVIVALHRLRKTGNGG